MTITTTTTENYAQSADIGSALHDQSVEAEPVNRSALPKLFWASAISFAANVAVVIGILVSPELKVNMYGQISSLSSTGISRPSPFSPKIEVAGAKLPKQAVKLRPVAFEPVPAGDAVYADSLAVPRVTQVSMSGNQMSGGQMSGSQLDIRRVTPASLTVYAPEHSLQIRRASQPPLVNSIPVEIAPRRASERAAVVMN